MLEGLAYMHELSIVHTDLKTENILITTEELKDDGQAPDIKIIDFGSAIFEEDYHPHVITTRDYRAPEVILDLGWSYPCDLWSMGCMFFEMATGLPLFITRDDLEHLAMMEQVLGPIPEAISKKSVGSSCTGLVGCVQVWSKDEEVFLSEEIGLAEGALCRNNGSECPEADKTAIHDPRTGP